MQLSPNFSLNELTRSSTAIRLGIDNTPPDNIFEILSLTAVSLEKVRSLLGHPIRISSGYRCFKLNTAIGGSIKSDHMFGYAADFTCDGFGSPYDVAKAIEKSAIKFGQLIYEGTWVHISFNPAKSQELLTAKFSKSGVSYLPGIVKV